MERKTKLELGAAAVCAAVIGVSVIAAPAEGNADRIVVEDRQSTSVSQTSSASEEQDVILGSVIDTAKLYSVTGESLDISVSFSAIPDDKLSTAEKLVFVSDDPPVTVIVPVERYRSEYGQVTVSGIISDVQGYSITLTDCTITAAEDKETAGIPDRAPQTQKAEVTTAAPQTTAIPAESTSAPPVNTAPPSDEVGATVYVSSSGKYHSKPNCSGMKNYTEMTYSSAVDKGCVPCKKCFG